MEAVPVDWSLCVCASVFLHTTSLTTTNDDHMVELKPVTVKSEMEFQPGFMCATLTILLLYLLHMCLRFFCLVS